MLRSSGSDAFQDFAEFGERRQRRVAEFPSLARGEDFAARDQRAVAFAHFPQTEASGRSDLEHVAEPFVVLVAPIVARTRSRGRLPAPVLDRVVPLRATTISGLASRSSPASAASDFGRTTSSLACVCGSTT